MVYPSQFGSNIPLWNCLIWVPKIKNKEETTNFFYESSQKFTPALPRSCFGGNSYRRKGNSIKFLTIKISCIIILEKLVQKEISSHHYVCL